MLPNKEKLTLLTSLVIAGILFFTTSVEAKPGKNDAGNKNAKECNASKNDLPIKVFTKAKTFDLFIEDITSEVQLFIRDKNGHVLYKENITDTRKFAKRFDLKTLPNNNNYYLEIQEETKLTIMPMVIAKNEVSFRESKEVVFFKPVIRTNGYYVDVTYLSFDKAALKIAIYDSADRLLHEETLSGKTNQGRRYDLSKKGPGDYRFSLSSNGKYYTEMVNVGPSNIKKPKKNIYITKRQ